MLVAMYDGFYCIELAMDWWEEFLGFAADFLWKNSSVMNLHELITLFPVHWAAEGSPAHNHQISGQVRAAGWAGADDMLAPGYGHQ